jgi:hypothetical protein
MTDAVIEYERPYTPPAERPADPFALLVQAVDKGMDPAQLKALIDLQEQWRAARAKEAFAVAMNAVQAEMPCIVRDSQNSQTKSSYVRLETITHQAKPIYTQHGFSLSFSEEDSKTPNWHRIVCLIRHIDGHSERHWIDLPTDGVGAKGNAIGAMNPVQGAISTGTYGQRVLTCRVFNITIADTDLDGNRPAHENPTPDASSPTAPPRSGQPVSREQCAELFAYWQQKFPTEGKDEYATWVRGVARRGFAVFKSHEWSDNDYFACCRALNFDPEASS